MTSRAYWALVAVLIVVGLGLRTAALEVGFFTDDFAFASMLEERFPVARAPLDLFTFSDGSPDEVRTLIEHGFFPWWSAPEIRIAMLRPLSSALLALDHALFGHAAVLYHLHGMLWWAALVMVVASILGRTLPRPMAIAAVALYALDQAHTDLLAWIANRNATVAATLGLLALDRHLAWHQHRRVRDRVGSVTAYVLGLAAGEYAVCVLGFFLAHALVGASERPSARVRAIAPFFLLTVAYLAVHRALGYGAYGSEMYLEPFSEPVRYALAGLERIPVFLGDMLLSIRAEWFIHGPPIRDMAIHRSPLPPTWWRHAPTWQPVQVAVGLAVGVVAAVAALRAARTEASATRRGLGWLALGSLIAMVPVVSSFPSSRLLVVPLVGGSAILGFALIRSLTPWREFVTRPRLRPALVLAPMLLWLHAVLAPEQSRIGIAILRDLARGVESAMLDVDLPRPASGEVRVLFTSARDPQTPLYFPIVRAFRGRPAPRSAWVLSMAPFPHRLIRIDERTLDLHVIGGTMLAGPFERLFRADALPFRLGDRVELPGLSITIAALRHGRPATLRLVFDGSPDDPTWLWLEPRFDGYAAIAPPRPGESMLLPLAGVPDGRAAERFSERPKVRWSELELEPR